MLKQIQGGDKRKGGIRMWVDPKKVNGVTIGHPNGIFFKEYPVAIHLEEIPGKYLSHAVYL